MHSYHKDIHEHGLQDGCSECEHHANNPASTLDMEMLYNLIELALDRSLSPRTQNEAIAVAKVLTDFEHVGRYLEAAPMEILDYYRDKWRIYIPD